MSAQINDLKDKANEISLMLIMTSAGDAAGIELLLTLCDDLRQMAVKAPGQERLVSAIDELRGQAKSDQILDLIREFADSATKFLENNGAADFKSEKTAGALEESDDVSNSVDLRFLAEYIETHTLLLEEFEASLLDFQNNGSGEEDLCIAVKRYLHNLKGDSGSIGLMGIERVCHHLEDILVSTSAGAFLPHLLQFKQWAIQCMEAYAAGKKQPVSAAQFIDSLTCDSPTKEAEVQQVQQQELLETVPSTERTAGLEEYTLSGEKDILLEFAAEAEEHLNNVESVILDSEGTYSKEAIDTIFRGVHSIKGGSAYFTIEEMTRCSHILENFLSEVRDGKRDFDQQLSDLLLKYIDLQKNVLTRAKKAAAEDGKLKQSQESIDFLSSLDAYGSGKFVPKKQAAMRPAPVEAPSEANSLQQADASDGQKTDKLSLKTFVKVDTARLDLLIDSIGEMMIYSSMLVRHCRDLLHDNESVMDATHRVEKFARDLQDIGMSMRLVPIKGLFQKMSRLVWDTSKKIGKEVMFSMEGEDTELDRNLIDKLADPLMHMIRNSVDHGIETPEEREAKGKSRAGKVKLSAYHAGGSIHIRIEDDGKGLNPDKLIAKAMEKGIIAEGQKLTESEAHALIFAPGFSTAAAVTDISGRGVGMDVVRRNVESLRGRIHIESKVDKGSVFIIELPLTLAIIDGIQVQVGVESFIIPSLSIIEFVKPHEGMLTSAMDHGETLHFRGKYLPIYRIADLYGIEAQYDEMLDATMVIVECNQEQIALMVDDILGECSTVIKSLGSLFEEGRGIAGCAIMPKGNVALILDVRSLVQLARTEYMLRSDKRTLADAQVIHPVC